MFDPSKMDPKAMMELSQLVQQLPPERLNKMQTLMHNMMAGYDVRKEMEEFEKTLPPDFRSKVMSLMAGQMGTTSSSTPETIDVSPEPSARDARLTVLRAVAEGKMSPEEAEKILF